MTNEPQRTSAGRLSKHLLYKITEEIALFMKTTPLLNHSIFASDEHLFYNCEIKRSFWVELRSWLTECNINLEPLSVVYVFFFGIFNAGKNSIRQCKSPYSRGKVLHLSL